MLPEVLVLGNRIGSNFTTQTLADQLVRDGVPAHPVTRRMPRNRSADVWRRQIEATKLIVNDGVSRLPTWWDPEVCSAKWLNVPWTVATSSDKLEMFQQLALYDVPALRWTESRDEAVAWASHGNWIICRHRLNGARGQGIEVCQPDDIIPEARLYTQLFKGKFVKEYRAYIVDGKVVDLAMKMRRKPENLIARGIDPDDEYKKLIRTWGNGWVFARNSWERRPLEVQIVTDLAEQAAKVCAMGYGGIDIAVRRWKDRDPEAVVIETNTHIGFEATTRGILSKAIKEVYDEAP